MSVIRPAAPHDVPAILQMIHDLADLREGTGRRPEHPGDAAPRSCSARIPGSSRTMAENAAGEVQGFALWFLNYSTWEGVHGIYLEDLYVRPEARGEGHGKALLQHLAATAVERGYARVEWSVLDWNEPSINFYRSLAPPRWRNGPPSASPARRWTRLRRRRHSGPAPWLSRRWLAPAAALLEAAASAAAGTRPGTPPYRGMRTAEHWFTVPLDHFAPRPGPAARPSRSSPARYVSAEHSRGRRGRAALAALPAGRPRRTRQPVRHPWAAGARPPRGTSGS